MITKHGINHLTNSLRLQFSKLNTRSVRRHFEESNRTKRQSYYYATERWRDIKIALIKKLAKVKSYLNYHRKPITYNKYFIETRDAIELPVSMVEMAYCLPYKHEVHTTAINLIDAQLEKINSQATFAREQGMLEMMNQTMI